MSKLKDMLFGLKVGAKVENLGRADEVVIRYKDKLISLLEDPDTGEIKSLGWMNDNELHTSVKIRDFWSASPPKGGKK